MDDRRIWRTALAMATCLIWSCQSHGQSANPEIRVAKLVKQLGSDEFDARRAADLELLKLGAQGRAQLDAAAHAADPEIRLRAQALLKRLAIVQLWEPTRITLQANNDDVGTLFLIAAKQTGNNISFGDPHSEPNNRTVSVDLQQKPYWQAVDELAQLSGNQLRPHFDGATQGIVITRGTAGRIPSAYVGPFRVQVTSARRAFTEEFDYEEHRADVTDSFQLNLQVLWEDRFRLIAYVPQLEVVEAITDTGISLGSTQPVCGNWNVASSSTHHLLTSVKLNPPPIAARKLRKLKLRWSLMALAEMATVELEDLNAKSQLSLDGLRLSLETFEQQPMGRVNVTLLVSRDIAMPDPLEIFFQENEIELFDTQGKPMRLRRNNHKLGERGVEFHLTYTGETAESLPAKLRFTYPKLRSRRDIEITFLDVPLPKEMPR